MFHNSLMESTTEIHLPTGILIGASYTYSNLNFFLAASASDKSMNIVK